MLEPSRSRPPLGRAPWATRGAEDARRPHRAAQPLARGASRAAPLALAVLAALCLQGAGMDTIFGLHAAKSVTSFSPKRTGSIKLKGKPNIDKIKAQAFKVARHGPKPTKTSMFHLLRMARRPENATVMQKGCEAMTLICMNANEQASLSRKGACAAVVVTLKKHRANAPVVLAALKLATNLCYAQPRNPFGFAGWAHTHAQDELGQKRNGIADIVKAMANHTASVDILKNTLSIVTLCIKCTRALTLQNFRAWKGASAGRWCAGASESGVQ
jgi:hypothetical protein